LPLRLPKESDPIQMTIAIIGAGPGIGMALARRFGREGHAIGLIARSQGIDTLAAELAAEGLKAKAYRADATVPSTIGEVLADIEANLGPVNVMVFNAAAVSYLPLTQLTPAQLVWRKIWARKASGSERFRSSAWSSRKPISIRL